MKRHFHILLTGMAVCFLAGRVIAAAVPSEFNMANKLYAEGKFVEAANFYEKILQSGSVSPNLLFNYGNAEFKAGHLGRAIAAYRQAEQLAPRNAEVRANLDFARNQVKGPASSESRWADWLGTLTLNEWTTLTATALWVAFLLFAAMQIRPALKTALRGLTRGVVVVTIFSGICCGAAASIHFSEPTAVVITPDLVARSGPFADAQKVFTAHDGAEFTVSSRQSNWIQVADSSGKIGWFENGQVKILPGI